MTQSVKEIFEQMPQALKAERAQGVEMVFQFNITGDESGQWHIQVSEGVAVVGEGEHQEPTCTITIKDEHWLKLVAGEMNPAMAFMTGKLKVDGDLLAAQKVGALFGLGS